MSSFDFLVCGWGKEEVYLRISEHLCFVSLCVYLKKTFKKNLCKWEHLCVST